MSGESKKRSRILGISSVVSMSGRVRRFRKEVQTDNYCFVLGKKESLTAKIGLEKQKEAKVGQF